ncbi:MAG: SusC/RagA family TonB-linked outer membrane protein [Pedobacter sp.]|nr:SusC/RagA family TonB-linked outer membrane protein [Chitinophagaceae bacterium]
MTTTITKQVKKILQVGWLVLFVLVSYTQANAQQNAVVTGTVINEKSDVLFGVTVKVASITGKENYVTTTDEKGLFVFKKLIIGKAYEFSISYVGYDANTIKNYVVKQSDNNSLLLKLKVNNAALEEVVVTTALGIKRAEKSLGYAAQSVTENAVKDAKTNNWVNSLSGKVAGLNIQGTGSGPIGSSRITLRGENSLNLDNNQALIVVDGIPISSKITGTGFKAHLATDSPVDFGSDLSDINPDDIASVTVLKGPSATALYGSRAASGALIITTKSGARKDKGLGVTFNSNFSIDRVNRWVDNQYEYGEGRTNAYFSYLDSPDGINTATNVAAGRAFGPKYNGQLYFQYDPTTPDGKPTVRTPWVAYPDYIKGFFQTGTTLTNSLSIEGGTDKGSARLSISQLKNKWILPNTGYERFSVALSVNQKVSDKLKISGKVTYTNKKSDNLPSAGYNNQTLMYFLIIGTTPNFKPEWFKPYWQPGLVGIQQRNPAYTGPDNPYIDLYEDLNKLNKHGILGNVSANYEFNKHLELMVRTGVDMSFEFRSQQRPYSITKYPQGSYREQNVFNYEINSDALLTYKNQIHSDIKYGVSAGANAQRQTYDFAGLYADKLAQPGIYQISNSLDQAVADPSRSKKSVNSLYATTQWSYKERVFLDVTGRNDWSSTLPYANNSFFYPSISTSFLLNEIFRLPNKISFAKIRLSAAQVGNDTRPYQTSKYYDRIYGNSFTNPATLFNADLKPEKITSYEVGLDFRIFKSRLGLDVTYYQNKNRNQIIAIPLDPTSGYANALINAGLIEAKGVEVQLKGTPILHPNFKWEATLNWSTNASYVKELANGVTSQIIYAHESNATIEARVGGKLGDIYGKGFQRSSDGQILYGSTGLPLALDQNTKKWGNAFADWKAGLNNEFTFQNFRVSILFDYQHGGSIYSQTNHKNNTLGKTRITLPGRETGIVGNGVVQDATGKYVPNTVNVSAISYYETYYAIGNAETNIFDATYLKLREARIEYNLPKKLLSKMGIVQSSIALYGRDLFNITNFPGYDPEGGNLNSGQLTPGVELTQFPSTRTMGINLTFKF